MFAHLRTQRLIPLFSEGLLSPAQSENVRRHAAACPLCFELLSSTEETIAALRENRAAFGEPRLSTSALVARIEGRLDESNALGLTHSPSRLRLSLLASALAAACLALFATWLRPPQPPADKPSAALVSDESLDRLERTLQREGIARYLNEAGDVLVATTATVADCENSRTTVDLASAPGTSRDLLARRVQLVASGAPPFAEPVLDDVEYALRDVAELPSCARRTDVARVRQKIERRQLLLRMRLAVRELEG